MGSLFFALLGGALAGLGGWAIVEPMSPGLADMMAWARWQILYALSVGGCIGAAIGAINGWNQGSRLHMFRGLAFGLLIGAVGGVIGMQFGGAVMQLVLGPGGSIETAPKLLAVFARSLAFIPFGASIGMVVGAAGQSWKRAFVGALGGAVGGLIAGMSFDLIASALGSLTIAMKGGAESTDAQGIPRVVAEIGAPARAATAALLGGSIGLFTAIFIQLTRSAWVRLTLGRNEFKEWIVDAPQTFLGRSERAQVPLFGDMNVAPMHACIQRQGGQYALIDGGSPMGTYLNGQRVAQAQLFDGAVIQIGGYQLQFLLRSGTARHVRDGRAYGTPAPGYPHGPAAGSPAGTQTVPNVTAFPLAAPPPMAPSTAGQPNLQPTVAIPAAQGALHLVCLDGPLAGQRFPIAGAMELGRAAGPIPLAFDASISRSHARLSPGPGGIALEDLGSANGTFVNGQRVTKTTISPGDIVKIGGVSFRLEI